MIRNYFVIALRNIRRYKGHAGINILGLAVALAACTIIFLVLQHEFSYDQYHKHANRTYQLVRKDVYPDGDNFDIGMPFPTIRALRNDFPKIKFAEIFTSYGSQVTVMQNAETISNKKFIEGPGIIFAEPELFDMLDVKWLAGNATALNSPGLAAISRSQANKYFGDWKAAMGRYLKLDNNILIQVAAVMEDVPVNSDFPFQIVPSYKTFLANKDVFSYTASLDNWGGSSSNHQVYALLPEGSDAEGFNSRMPAFLEKYYPDKKNQPGKLYFFLNPLKNIHFDTRFGHNGDHVSSKTSLMTLALIGLLIILMACINFVNLSTALAVKRSKEVGIRKVMGGKKSQLRLQVYLETFVIVCFAALLGLGLAWFGLPYLKYIADIQQPLQLLNSGSITFILAVILATTVISGFYPALVMSRFQPVEAIKNKINTTAVGGISLRRVLVVLQFAFSQLLIVATIIAVSQMNFIRDADLGMDKEAVLLVNGNADSSFLSRQPNFEARLRQVAGIRQLSFALDAPSSDNSWTTNMAFDNDATDKDFHASIKMGDDHYAETFGLQLLAGSFYPPRDSTPEFVINETMARKLGYNNPKDIVGKTIRLGGGKWLPVVGVVKDFKNKSLRDEIRPTVITNNPKFQTTACIKISAANLGKTNRDIEAIWESVYPEYAYSSTWLDESIQNFYRQEERLSRLYKVYAGLAIFISCLGLYGLVSFMAVQKTKEVGIRKVLGASISSILYLFSREFTILVVVAFVIAAPVAWFLMNNWLSNFVFKISIGAGVFVLSIAASLLIAWITVGYKAIRAALANPVKSLRSE
ncbi:ABC transporter permease [Flavihumibacter petaseus]|uniref:Putative ABC transporter permease protein n=1 Tax=Flavihumibacter petaseus NBRC 106054 TaxID=1220578 RepID=A0A0E9N3M8_9BACT|nr:ABC transporter permease [Flavihumibacter petaseus]GAO44383.1 putative ABC transporter permease protein [Flavihumibacter petaseus NBRC 106054]